MKERPILFSGPMVRAILDGRKTQTRRVVNWQKVAKQSGCTKGTLAYSDAFSSWAVFNGNGEAHLGLVDCPYGQSGDRLWVRETWCQWDWEDLGTEPQDPITLRFRADGDIPAVKWRPSIFMFRWASRITLEITNVRVERLQDISDADIDAEGCRHAFDAEYGEGWDTANPLYHWWKRWDKINGKKYPWSRNPWVWVIEFQREFPKVQA